MARPSTITTQDLIPWIRSRAPVSATELAELARVNRTTISRILPRLGDSLVTLGAGRSTRYALRREIHNTGHSWPIHRIGPDGRATEWATLEAMHDRLWRIQWHADAPAWANNCLTTDGCWHGFPFFLGDLRPQGFLGRRLARLSSRTLPVPDDPRSWSDDDTLAFLQSDGADLPGNLIVGTKPLRSALETITRSDGRTESDYPSLARESLDTPIGSSAGGEQPKFLCQISTAGSRRAVLVKFSPPLDQPLGRRWADLLIAEWHAHQVLARAGLSSGESRVIQIEDRWFLEVERFDRTPTGGRIGVVSLEALHAAAVGTYARNWPQAAHQLHQAGWINDYGLQQIQLLHAFGECIGNSDMHFGNLSFFWNDSPHFHPAPSYDMLPMHWAPSPQGELMERQLPPILPSTSNQPRFTEAALIAREFWQNLTDDPQLSDSFRLIAHQASQQLTPLFENHR